MPNESNASPLLTVSSSPHFHGGDSTRGVMIDVLLALLPAGVMSVVLFGPRSLLLIAVSVLSCLFFEAVTRRLLHRSFTLGDCSAAVTGVLLAFNLPVSAPWWLPVIGAFVAIVVVKQFFGGLGQNFVNPALVGRITLMVSFPAYMTMPQWPSPRLLQSADAVSAATPLAELANGTVPSLSQMTTVAAPYNPLSMLLGLRPGSLGETCAAALLIGGLYLCLRRVISPVIPLTFAATTVGITWLAGQNPYYNLTAGGLLLGAIFMATDYATCPISRNGKLLYAFGCGLITAVIRLFGNMPEGVSVAIVLMNILTPHIDRLTLPRPFGVEKARRGRKGEQA